MEGKNGEREVKVVIDWSDVTVQSFPLPFESSAGVCASKCCYTGVKTFCFLHPYINIFFEHP
jgi:hypothetical protein